MYIRQHAVRQPSVKAFRPLRLSVVAGKTLNIKSATVIVDHMIAPTLRVISWVVQFEYLYLSCLFGA